ncbi:hypothetical protein ZHAS_00002491 [Anopheles sinensis]|uniref:Uncharacterized protein n=1 Tax=Anopheles sinensis TaxID=74873 RepID=A0A084VCE2_ANOSI|nr:hypothetical protein ZHAS_00002491 [Anopheles sinensis]
MEPTPGGDRFSSLDELQRQLNEDFAQSIGPLTPTPENAGAAGTSAASSSGGTIATTISTVVLQGGPLQLVVAILKVGLTPHQGEAIPDAASSGDCREVPALLARSNHESYKPCALRRPPNLFGDEPTHTFQTGGKNWVEKAMLLEMGLINRALCMRQRAKPEIEDHAATDQITSSIISIPFGPVFLLLA